MEGLEELGGEIIGSAAGLVILGLIAVAYFLKTMLHVLEAFGLTRKSSGSGKADTNSDSLRSDLQTSLDIVRNTTQLIGSFARNVDRLSSDVRASAEGVEARLIQIETLLRQRGSRQKK